MFSVFELDFDGANDFDGEIPYFINLDYLSVLTDEYKKNKCQINSFYLKNEIRQIEEYKESSMTIEFY